MIDVNKCKLRNGRKFKIYTTEGMDPAYPVVGEINYYHSTWGPHAWRADGKSHHNPDYDLVEVGPYDHIPVGQMVAVWNRRESPLDAVLRRFAGVSASGQPLTMMWYDSADVIAWDHCLTVEDYAERHLTPGGQTQEDYE